MLCIAIAITIMQSCIEVRMYELAERRESL